MFVDRAKQAEVMPASHKALCARGKETQTALGVHREGLPPGTLQASVLFAISDSTEELT